MYNWLTGRYYPALPRRRDEDAYRKKLVERYILQFEWEGVETWGLVSGGLWKSYQHNLSRRDIRHKTFWRPTNCIAVVSRLGTKELSGVTVSRTELIDEWVRTMPENKRVGGTRGFGGPFAGSVPDNSSNGEWLYTTKGVAHVEYLMRRDEIPHCGDNDGGNVDFSKTKREVVLEYARETLKAKGGPVSLGVSGVVDASAFGCTESEPEEASTTPLMG